jgi:hypothetical protein
MRKLFGLVAALGLVMSAAQPAHAVVQSLSSASLMIVIGTLPAIPIAWNGTGSADVTATSVTGLTAGIFSFTGSLPVSGAAPIAGLSITGASNGTGNFFGVDTALGGGPMAVQGVANICLFVGCAASPPANVVVPFTEGPGVNGIGLGGASIAVAGFVNVTVMGNMWTTGAVTLAPGFSASGSPLSGGHVKLVTPTVISTNLAGSEVIPSFAILDLTFVPEPGTLVLLASGVAGLAMVGRKRMSK